MAGLTTGAGSDGSTFAQAGAKEEVKARGTKRVLGVCALALVGVMVGGMPPAWRALRDEWDGACERSRALVQSQLDQINS